MPLAPATRPRRPPPCASCARISAGGRPGRHGRRRRRMCCALQTRRQPRLGGSHSLLPCTRTREPRRRSRMGGMNAEAAGTSSPESGYPAIRRYTGQVAAASCGGADDPIPVSPCISASDRTGNVTYCSWDASCSVLFNTLIRSPRPNVDASSILLRNRPSRYYEVQLQRVRSLRQLRSPGTGRAFVYGASSGFNTCSAALEPVPIISTNVNTRRLPGMSKCDTS